MPTSDVSHKDVVIAAFGASAALAGLVLVFLGTLIAAYQPLIGEAIDSTLDKFKFAAKAALGVFALSLASVTLSAAWLAAAGGHRFYIMTLALFFVQLAALALLAWYSTFRVLLEG